MNDNATSTNDCLEISEDLFHAGSRLYDLAYILFFIFPACL